MIRRFGAPRKEGVKYIHRPGAYAILPRGNQILATHQYVEESEIQLPGGGIDPGESPTTALHREVMEETGWRIAQPRFLLTWRRFTFMPDYDMWAEKLCHIYVAKPVRPVCDPTEEGHTALWLGLDVATGLLTNEGDGNALGSFLEGRSRLKLR